MIIIFMYSKYHDSVIEVDCQGHQISYNYFKWVSSKYKKFKNGKKKKKQKKAIYLLLCLSLYRIRLEDPTSTLTNLHTK